MHKEPNNQPRGPRNNELTIPLFSPRTTYNNICHNGNLPPHTSMFFQSISIPHSLPTFPPFPFPFPLSILLSSLTTF